MLFALFIISNTKLFDFDLAPISKLMSATLTIYVVLSR